jgi:hypothetical protein
LWYLAHQEPRYGKKRDSIGVDLEFGGIPSGLSARQRVFT